MGYNDTTKSQKFLECQFPVRSACFRFGDDQFYRDHSGFVPHGLDRGQSRYAGDLSHILRGQPGRLLGILPAPIGLAHDADLLFLRDEHLGVWTRYALVVKNLDSWS